MSENETKFFKRIEVFRKNEGPAKDGHQDNLGCPDVLLKEDMPSFSNASSKKTKIGKIREDNFSHFGLLYSKQANEDGTVMRKIIFLAYRAGNCTVELIITTTNDRISMY